MLSRVSRREIPISAPKTRLNAVWYVEADERYGPVRKAGAAPGQHVALRTLSGEGLLWTLSGEEYRLGADSLLLISSDDIARYHTAQDRWVFYWFQFDWEASFRLLADVPMSAQERVELEKCFVCLDSGMSAECALSDALFGYRMAEWLLHTQKNRNTPAQSIVALLEKGRREHLSISEMARQAGMCERSFRDAVCAATGLSPKACLLKGEMAAAMELLRTTALSISEISDCVGYANPFYFSRVFKKYYGVSPSQVRDAMEL